MSPSQFSHSLRRRADRAIPFRSYQSIRSLYFGNINTITSLTGVSWSLTNLRTALGQIITARQPEHIKTLDHLSDFDAGDHSDHLATARIANSLIATYAPSASFAG